MITITTEKSQANCITHSGKMHADETFSTAFLELYLKDIKVCRTNKIDKEDYKENTYIYDIGFGKYDHHQLDASKRDNGITYCSFGLLWKELGIKFLESMGYENIEKIFQQFDTELVEAIDAEDNGFFPKIEANFKVKTLSSVIEMFNPSYDSKSQSNDQFLKAVSFAKELIIQELEYINSKVKAFKEVSNIVENTQGSILVLDKYLPYTEALFAAKRDDILLVIFPSERGGYNIKTIQKSIEDHTLRLSFPEEWAGLQDMDLENVCQVKDATFCHNKLFIAGAKTKTSAITLANKAIQCKVEKEKKEALLTKED